MRKQKKLRMSFLFGIIAALALSLGIAFRAPAPEAQAQVLDATANWTVAVEGTDEAGISEFRIQNGNVYWTGNTDGKAPAGITDYTEINGMTLSAINAKYPGAVTVTLQNAGGTIGSFFRVRFDSTKVGFTSQGLGTFVLRSGWTHTDNSGTYTLESDMYFAHKQQHASQNDTWKLVANDKIVDISDDIVIQDQGVIATNTRSILLKTTSDKYWTGYTPNEHGASFLNMLYVNGKSIAMWNSEAYAALDAGEITDITYGSGHNTISGNKGDYAPIFVWNAAYDAGVGGCYAQTWIPTGYISDVSSYKVCKGMGWLQDDGTFYYVSKDVEYVKSGSSFEKIASSVDISDKFKILAQDHTSSNGTMLYYLHTDNIQYWAQQYGSTGGYAINEKEWKIPSADSSIQGGAVQMSYIEFNGKNLYDINATDNGAYGATQGNIASGGKYAPILAFLTTAELGNAIKIQVSSAYPSGSGTAADNHKTITIKKGFYIVDTSTNIKYEVTKDIQWDYENGAWGEHVEKINATVSDLKVIFDGSDTFLGVAIDGNEYANAGGTWAGNVQTALSFAQKEVFYKNVYIDDVQMEKPGEAFLNVWNNFGYFSFRKGSVYANTTKLTLKAGCQIPTYNALATGAKEVYLLTEDVTYVKDAEGNWAPAPTFDAEAYKAEQISVIEGYKSGLFFEEQEAERAERIAMAKAMIEQATEKAAIDEIVAATKAEIDELPTMAEILEEQLRPIKDAAIAEIDAYNNGELTAWQALDREKAVAEGKALVEAASSEADVTNALETAKALIDASLEKGTVVDTTAVIKVVDCYAPNGNIYMYIFLPEIDTDKSGDEMSFDGVDVAKTLDMFGLWDNILIGDKSLREWGITGGWDNTIGFNCHNPLNNIYIHCHSADIKANPSALDFTGGLLSNYDITIKEGAYIPGYNYFAGADSYTIYKTSLEVVSQDANVSHSFYGLAETEVADVAIAQDNGDSTYLAIGLTNNDYPVSDSHEEAKSIYYQNGFWQQKVVVNGGVYAGQYALYNLHEAGRGRIAITIHLPGSEIKTVTIPAGTRFPTYAMQSFYALNKDGDGNNASILVLLETKHDVTFERTDDGTWVNVTAYRNKAIEEINAYRQSKINDYYFADGITALEDALDLAIVAIASAEDVKAIDVALEASKASMDAVETKTAYIDQAKAEVQGYKAGLFREAEEASRQTAVNTVLPYIDSMTTKEEVNDIVAEFKAEVDKLKTAAQYADEELAPEKESARAEISNYLDVNNYYEKEQAEIALAIEAGHNGVANAASKEEITQAVADAKAALDAILTKEEAVAKVKADLANYGAEDGYFRAEEKQERDAIVEKALADLEGLTDMAEIEVIVNAAIAQIDELTTADEYLEAELEVRKVEVRAIINAYLDGDYVLSQEAEIIDAVEDALSAVDGAKSVEEIEQAFADAIETLDAIVASVKIVDVVMVARITAIGPAGGNTNLHIAIPNALLSSISGDDIATNYSKEELEKLFEELGLFDKVYIKDKSLREWGFVGFWNGTVGFNVEQPNPSIYLHITSTSSDFTDAEENGDITFTKYEEDENGKMIHTVMMSSLSVEQGLLIPSHDYLTGKDGAVVFRAVMDFTTEGMKNRPYDVQATATTTVDSVAYVQEDIKDDVFTGGYFGVSLVGDDFPAFEGAPVEIAEYIRYHANYDQILINGQEGLVDKYGLFNLGTEGKGRISFAVKVANKDMYSITIPAGTKFPAYASNVFPESNSGNGLFVFYTTEKDVTFVKLSDGSWVNFEDYRDSAVVEIEELRAGKDDANCFEADVTVMNEAVANAKEALANATTVAEIDEILANVKAIVEPILSKEEVVAKANEEIANYKADKFLEAEEAQRLAIVEATAEPISLATSSQEVASIVAEAKAAIDALKTADDYAREAIAEDVANAKAELEAYKAEEGLYREEEANARQLVIDEAKARLDQALSLDEVAAIVSDAKAAIDALKTDAEHDFDEALAVAKEEAKEAISNVKAAIDLTLYTEENVMVISALYKDALAAVDAAASQEEVAQIIAKFEADVDAVPQIGQEGEGNESTEESSSEEISTGCLGTIGGLSSVFALLGVMAVAVLLKKKR